MKEARGDLPPALRLHRWNAQICETLYIPTQMVEVGFRNTMQSILAHRFSPAWPLLFKSNALQALPKGAREQIQKAATALSKQKVRAPSLTCDAVVANLSFGFWCRMLDSDYEGVLWQNGVHHAFPRLPQNMNRTSFQEHMTGIRDIRNRIAHHKPIFTKKPQTQFRNIMDALSWLCPDAYDFVKSQTSDFNRVISAKPQPKSDR